MSTQFGRLGSFKCICKVTKRIKDMHKIPQTGPSSERSGQSTLPLQILSGVRQTEVSLAQGYLGGLQTADSQDSSSERSSQSMSPSHTQLFVIHFPAQYEMSRWLHLQCRFSDTGYFNNFCVMHKDINTDDDMRAIKDKPLKMH